MNQAARRRFAKHLTFGYNLDQPGRGAAWLARYNGVVEVPGSNPGAPTERQPVGRLPLFASLPSLTFCATLTWGGGDVKEDPNS
jgi:hypothetical protein